MDYHKNARLTAFSREQLAKRALSEGFTPKRRSSGSGGIASMAWSAFSDRSSRPHRTAVLAGRSKRSRAKGH